MTKYGEFGTSSYTLVIKWPNIMENDNYDKCGQKCISTIPQNINRILHLVHVNY